MELTAGSSRVLRKGRANSKLIRAAAHLYVHKGELLQVIEPTKIDHVCLMVSDLNRAKSYYELLFGAKCRLREDKPKMLIVEAKNVHFFLSESETDTAFQSMQHLSLQVSNLADVISKLEALEIAEYETGIVDLR